MTISAVRDQDVLRVVRDGRGPMGRRGVAARQDLVLGFAGDFGPGQLIGLAACAGPSTYTAASSVIVAVVAPTSEAVFTITKNGAAFATATIPAGQNDGAVAFVSSGLVETGDLIAYFAPQIVDPTLESVGITLAGD